MTLKRFNAIRAQFKGKHSERQHAARQIKSFNFRQTKTIFEVPVFCFIHLFIFIIKAKFSTFHFVLFVT